MRLKGLNFADVAEIQEAVTDELNKKYGCYTEKHHNTTSILHSIL
jgi:hypothetical protein